MMPLIKVKDLAYGRLRAPDLDQMEEFLIHFGMTRAASRGATRRVSPSSALQGVVTLSS